MGLKGEGPIKYLPSSPNIPSPLRGEACPESPSSFDKLRTNGIEGVRVRGKSGVTKGQRVLRVGKKGEEWD